MFALPCLKGFKREHCLVLKGLREREHVVYTLPCFKWVKRERERERMWYMHCLVLRV